MAELLGKFVFELVAWAAHAGFSGVATLDHEAWDDAVEMDAIVVTTLGEVQEVGDGYGRFRSKEGGFNIAFAGEDFNPDVFAWVGIFVVGFATGREKAECAGGK